MTHRNPPRVPCACAKPFNVLATLVEYVLLTGRMPSGLPPHPGAPTVTIPEAFARLACRDRNARRAKRGKPPRCDG